MREAREESYRILLSVCCDGFGLCAQQGLVSRALELLAYLPSVNFSQLQACGPAPGTLAPALLELAVCWL